jgi:hypothetical protein
MTGPDYAAEIKSTWSDPHAVLEALGLLRGAQRQAAGFLVCCPVHGEKTPSCSVQLRGGILQWHCFGCDSGGDVLALVAACRGLDTRVEFRGVLLAAAELAGRNDIVDAIEGRPTEPRPAPTPRPAPEPMPERTYPPQEEVLDLLAACTMTARDPGVTAYLKSRGLDADAVDVRGLAYALPQGAPLPRWARYRGQTWIETGHRLIVPIRDHAGEARSVRAGRIVDNDTPKRLPPGGHTCRGLVLADAMAVEVLRAGSWPSWAKCAPAIVICEGEPDHLTASCRTPLRACPDHGTIGIFAGSWTPEIAARVPSGARVFVWTHHDEAGDKYARQIAESLAGRCEVLRGGA